MPSSASLPSLLHRRPDATHGLGVPGTIDIDVYRAAERQVAEAELPLLSRGAAGRWDPAQRSWTSSALAIRA